MGIPADYVDKLDHLVQDGKDSGKLNDQFKEARKNKSDDGKFLLLCVLMKILLLCVLMKFFIVAGEL